MSDEPLMLRQMKTARFECEDFEVSVDEARETLALTSMGGPLIRANATETHLNRRQAQALMSVVNAGLFWLADREREREASDKDR